MILTDKQKQTIDDIISIFETGKVDGNYSRVTVINDGPKGKPQISYGKHQVNESSRLYELLFMYCHAGGELKEQFEPYLAKVAKGLLSDDELFKQYLKTAGKDKIMQLCQDRLFDQYYFQPAVKFCDEHWLRFPLSCLIIYDSYIHSGNVPYFLRKQFDDKTPDQGGDEKIWIAHYIGARREWLANHSSDLLRNCVYRMDCFIRLIALGNWDLLQRPIEVHGVILR
jgi:chitosanase